MSARSRCLLVAFALLVAAAPNASAAAPADTTAPRRAWLPGDPADSLYRAARQALSASRWREAANLFGQIGRRYPSSGYAADALYWRAFALYRLGGSRDLQAARKALDQQQEKYPQAATRGDAKALATQVNSALARMGDAGAAQTVATTATEATKGRDGRGRSDSCRDDEDDVQAAALNGLLQMDGDRAIPVLRKVLARRDAGSECLRRRAVFIVSQHRSPETESILLETARNDPDREVRGQAVFWLSQVGSETAVTALDSIVRQSKDPELQEKAIFALSQQESPRALAALRSYAERGDVPEENREKAIFWIGQRSGPETGAYLRALYAKLPSDALKEKTLFALSQRQEPENQKFLLDVAKNESDDMEMRKRALFWAGQSGVSLDELGGLYGSLRSQELKEQVIFTISQRSDSGAVTRLINIAKTEKDPELRKKAVFWLGQSRDPRAAAYLGELLEGR
jgi:HEAT repeat protein